MNNILFSTQGSFETTDLSNNGEPIEATELFFQLIAGRDEFGSPIYGGLSCGAACTSYIRFPQISSVLPLFPGSVEFHSPGYQIRVENALGVDPAYMMVWVNGICVNDRIMDLTINVNADTGALEGYLCLYEDNWILPDEIVQTALF